jgi:DNA polymerase III delta prime subunit
MELVGTSSLFVEKYRPQTINDLILPANFKKLFDKFISDKDIPNLIFSSSAGRGKTTTAYALCKDIGLEYLYINGSVETSIDTLRYKVTQFAMSNSFYDGTKVCIIDEAERLSNPAQDGMKALIEQTEANCRFILTTNNMSKIIDPIKSRCQLVDFNFTQTETKNLIIAYFKRICYILDNEKIKYDKKVLAEFTQKMYPDFRRTLNELQKFTKMHGEVSIEIFNNLDGAMFSNLVDEMKAKKFNNIRKIIADMNPEDFYQTFYDQIDELIEPTCMPNVIMVLGQYAYESSLSISKEITLAACVTNLLREIKWK